jgi:hypothetical protein
MFKRTMFSLFGAVILGTLLSVGPSVMAACDGWCADRILYNGQQYNYDGCTVNYDSHGNVTGGTCYYA